MTAPIPIYDQERLEALYQYDILDSEPEPEFESIVELAAQICGVPMAAITLVDKYRQWFKAIVGLDVSETSRDVSFCAHAILQSDLMIVPDAQTDARFSENPAVTGDPKIRFYAGAPLVTSAGFALGSLCVIDRVPRQLSPEQENALRILGQTVVTQLELRRQIAAQKDLIAQRDFIAAELGDAQTLFRSAIDATEDGFVLQDRNGSIRLCNQAAERILGLTTDQLMGRTSMDPHWHAINEDGSELPGEQHPIMRSLKHGKTLRNFCHGIYTSQDELRWISVSSMPLTHDGEDTPYAAVATFRDITETWQSDEARFRLAAIVDTSSDAIFSMTLDGTITTWNLGAERLYGYQSQDVIGRHASLLTPPEQSGLTSIIIQAIVNGQMCENIEIERIDSHDMSVHISLTCSPIKNQNGQIIGAAAIGRDITPQKQTEAKIRESEARLREAQNIAHIGSIDYDPATGKVTWSEEMFHIFGLDPNEDPPTYDELLRQYHPDDLVIRNQLFADALQNKQPYAYDMRIVKTDGTLRWCHVMGKPITNNAGEIVRIVGTMMDITERVASEERFRVLFEKSSDAHLLFDENGIIDCNNAAIAILGCTDKSHVQSLHPAVMSPEYQLDGRRSDEKCLEMDGIAWKTGYHRFEWLHRKMDGQDIPVEVTLTPVTLSDKPVMLVVWHDLTERKQMEEILLQSKQRLAEAQRVAHIGNWEYHVSSGKITWSEEMYRLLGLDPTEDEPSYDELLTHYHPDDVPMHKACIARTLQDGLSYQFDIRVLDALGNYRWAHAVGQAECDADGTVIRLFGTLMDIDARKRLEAQMHDYSVVLEYQKAELERSNSDLEVIATEDALTGLKNRRFFQEKIDEEMSRSKRYQIPLSVIMLDVDHFKQYNDTYGHPQGDEVLKTLAKLLQEEAREADIVARYGGEEFIILLPQTDSCGALVIAERLRVSIEKTSWPNRNVTASFGVAGLTHTVTNSAELVSSADKALYLSKHHGRNQIHLSKD